jgi:hypothetical protein
MQQARAKTLEKSITVAKEEFMVVTFLPYQVEQTP